MYHSKLVLVLLISVVLSLCTGAAIYPKTLQTQKGSASTTSVSALQTKDQSGSQDTWANYVEFHGSSTAYQGIFTFDASTIDVSSVGAYTLDVNFKGPQHSAQVWQFEFLEPASNTWILAGDNSAAKSWKWTALSFSGTEAFASLVANGNIQVRFSSTSGDDCDVDYLAITTDSSASSTPQTAAPTTAPTQQSTATTKPTKAPTAAPTHSASTPAPTKAPSKAPTTRPATPAPTKAPTTRPATPAPTKTPPTAPTTRPSTPAPTKAATPAPSTGGRMCPAGEVWAPAPGTTWQWQLTGTIDQTVDVQMYDIDLFDNDASIIASLHAKGRAVICYFSTQYENWRPDSASWPASVLGSNLDDWPGEKYADIRSSIVRGIMQSRLDLAVSKGCDGVEPDNVDEYTNTNGLGITAADQIDFNKFIASEAHKRGLSVGLKNDLDQVVTLQPNYDWALNEQCNQYGECADLSAFVNAGKAVFGVEYSGSASKFCPTMVTDKFSWLLKDLNLDASVTPCCTYASGGCAAKAAYTCVNYNAKREIENENEVAIVDEPVYNEFDSAATSVTFPFVALAFVSVLALSL